jgi:hypothetical protein
MIDARTDAMGEAVAEVAVMAVQSIPAVRIAVICIIIPARQGTTVSRIVNGSRRTGVLARVGLRGSRDTGSKTSSYRADCHAPAAAANLTLPWSLLSVTESSSSGMVRRNIST